MFSLICLNMRTVRVAVSKNDIIYGTREKMFLSLKTEDSI